MRWEFRATSLSFKFHRTNLDVIMKRVVISSSLTRATLLLFTQHHHGA